jgi:hypothetical protein
MVPLYSARIEDLGLGDVVKMECVACGHETPICDQAQKAAHPLRFGGSIARHSPLCSNNVPGDAITAGL